MAVNLTISQRAQSAALAAVLGVLDAGGAAKVRVYAGPRPAGPDAPATGATLLAEIVLPDPAFVQNAGAVTAALASIPAPVLAVATGTAAWFRLVDGNGDGVADGSAGTGQGYAMMLNTVNFVVGVQVSIGSLTLGVPPLG